jgi:hypothetical protein
MRVLSLVAGLLLACWSLSAQAQEWKFGPFLLPELQGYSYDHGDKPAYYRGPDGWASVGVYVVEKHYDETKTAELVARAIGMSRETFRDARIKFKASAIAPTTEETLPNGIVRVSLLAESTGPEGPEHLLMYNFISPRGDVGVLVLEGKGEAQRTHARHEKSLNGVRWRAR